MSPGKTAEAGATPMGRPFGRAYWVEEGSVLAGCYPGHQDAALAEAKVRGLVASGIRLVVNLMEASERDGHGRPFAPYEPLLARAAAEWGATAAAVRLPIRDMDVPTRSHMARILDEMDAALAAGKPVYVHCWGGHGRTGTVVGCWLARHGRAQGRSVLDHIRRLRRGLDDEHAPSPETAAQMAMVQGWKPGE